MRVALIADIHGNVTALDAVLADIDSIGVDQIVCLGDVSEGGPYPAVCLQRLMERDVPVVMGNTDERMLTPRNRQSDDPNKRLLDDIENWNVEQLSAAEKAFIEGFEPYLEVDLGQGLSLLGYHGSPQGNRDLIKANAPWAKLSVAFEGFDQQVLAGGHVHEQFMRPYRHQTILNTGSIGAPAIYLDEGGTEKFPEQWLTPVRAEYAMIEVSEQQINVMLKQVRYSRDELEQAVAESGMPHADFWMSPWI